MTIILDDIVHRCDAIEECYEFMLGYAAQGLSDDRVSRSGSQLRELLSRAVQAALGLSGAYSTLVRELRMEPAERDEAFLAVLERDTAHALFFRYRVENEVRYREVEPAPREPAESLSETEIYP